MAENCMKTVLQKLTHSSLSLTTQLNTQMNLQNTNPNYFFSWP